MNRAVKKSIQALIALSFVGGGVGLVENPAFATLSSCTVGQYPNTTAIPSYGGAKCISGSSGQVRAKMFCTDGVHGAYLYGPWKNKGIFSYTTNCYATGYNVNYELS
jgi:hypothetical protein